jgi:pimeloyl-ACP methyl ester carboxylesterase
MPAGMPDAPVILYLHGFASSAHSTKGTYLAQRLAEQGIALESPDFNLPEFTSLTMTRMLEQLDRDLLPGVRGATLVGSSLGGTLAVLAAARWPERVGQLILLAPAVMFAKEGHHLLPQSRIAEWRRRGALPFFHYAYGEERLLNVAFYEDSLQYDPFAATFHQPTLIFQGSRDEAVDPRTVQRFARSRPNVTLTMLDDDHQLVKSLPQIWKAMQAFLGLAA